MFFKNQIVNELKSLSTREDLIYDRIRVLITFRKDLLPQFLKNGKEPSEMDIFFDAATKFANLIIRQAKEDFCSIMDENGFETGLSEIKKLASEISSTICIILENHSSITWSRITPIRLLEFIKILLEFCHEFQSKGSSRGQEVRLSFKSLYDESKTLLEYSGHFADRIQSRDLVQVLNAEIKLLKILRNFEFSSFAKFGKIFHKHCQSYSKEDQAMDGEIFIGQEALDIFSNHGIECLENAKKLIKENCVGDKLNAPIKKVIFLARLLKEICTALTDYLGDDFSSLNKFIISLLKCNQSYISNNSSIKSEFKQQMVTMMPGLGKEIIKSLTKDKNYSDYMLQNNPGQENVFDNLLMYTHILYALPSTSIAIRRIWLTSNDATNLFRKVLWSIKSCDELKCQAFIQAPSHGGKASCLIKAYDYFISLIQAYLMNAYTSEMKMIERELLRCVTSQFDSSNLWTVKLASDLWCFIGRYGTSSYCFSHVKLLISVYSKHPNQFLSMLILRMSSFLTHQEIQWLESKLPLNKEGSLKIWSHLNMKKCSAGFKRSTTKVCISVFRDFSRGGNFNEFKKLLCSIKCLSQLWQHMRDVDKTNIKTRMVNLWNRFESRNYVVSSSSNGEIELMKDLMRLTSQVLQMMDNKDASKMLKSIYAVAQASYQNTFFYLLTDLLVNLPKNIQDTLQEQVSTMWKTLLLASITDAGLELKVSSNLFKYGIDKLTIQDDLKQKLSTLNKDPLTNDFNPLQTYGVKSDSKEFQLPLSSASQQQHSDYVDIENKIRGILTDAQMKINLIEGDNQQQNIKINNFKDKFNQFLQELNF